MENQFLTKPLTKKTFDIALAALKDRDPGIRKVISKFGPPPLNTRKQGFPSLVHIILEQQVSLASADAAFKRLQQAVPKLLPDEFMKLDDPTLRKIGFSRQKTRYCRNLATAIINETLRLDKLAKLADEPARAELLQITGIGQWTADIYLLTALKRPDIWPLGDLALAVAVQQVKRLTERPSSKALEKISERWKPWRAVAARVFWHHYLSKPS